MADFAKLRVGLAQINPTVGALRDNANKILDYYKQAVAEGCDVVAFPELSITGYPPEDLVLKDGFVAENQGVLAEIVKSIGETFAVIGFVDRATSSSEIYNAAAICHNGKVVGVYRKHLLPNYNVFDEQRYFTPGVHNPLFTIKGACVGVTICEDIWEANGPVSTQASLGAVLNLNINGSPFHAGKIGARREMLSSRARDGECVIAYVNQVGGQDELVFDGDSIVVNTDGSIANRASQFVEEIILFEVEPNKPISQSMVRKRSDDLEEVYQALVIGLRDYVLKNNLESVVLGISGGIDSALVAAIAVDALGANNVNGVSMPSPYSSEHSVSDAQDLATRTGLNYRSVPIKPMFDAYQESLSLSGLAEENLQARLRGMTLMAISNQEGHLVLATGNKSELAVGYSTIYGDAVGGFAPIKDVPKTLVWELSKWRNKQAGNSPIPEASITKEPSAELRPGQLDTDSLPDYEKLDPMINAYVEQDQGAFEMATKGLDKNLIEKVLKLIDQAEYKRRQYPPGTKISAKAFGRDRRQPITNSWRESL